jgi:hypothetical protein
MTRGAALSGALLVTLATPGTWPLAVAAFLIRGGIVLVALPILVLPTPVGLGSAIGPTLTSIALGSATVEVIAVSVAAIGLVSAWLFLGGWLAAALEAEAIRVVTLDDDVAALDHGPVPPTTGRLAARILAVRLIADIPLGLLLSWGSVRLITVAYHELTSPLDVSTPVVLRVLRASPEVVIAVGLAWMIGEIVGAVAARRIVLADAGIGGALRSAIAWCARHPLSTLGRFWVPTIALVVVLLPSAVAAASAGAAAGAVLGQANDPVRVLVAVVALVFLWIVGLLLASVVSAWRAAAWTIAEVAREGTFGGSADRRPGDWYPDAPSGNL